MYTPQQLVVQAERALESCEPQLAIKFVRRALELQAAADAGGAAGAAGAAGGELPVTSDARVFQLLGSAYVELVNTVTADTPDAIDVPQVMEAAREAFLMAVKLAPGVDSVKYLSLGQLSVSKEAIGYYETGVRLLMAEIEALPNGPQSEQAQILRNKLGSALCSMTEIYMTDCCDEPEAESKCEAYMHHAVEQNPSNPEVHQTLASVRLSQSRPDDARQSLEYAMDLWYREPTEDEPLVADPNWPGYPLRIALSKFLMEVGLHERALAVLQTCQVEDDEDAEMWYLFGWCYSQLAASQPELAEDARECFETVKTLDKMYPGSVDPEILQHIAELVSA
ncbi:hypothetical protein HK105_201972 [Polyrhizophydium stewartii]|uniref:Uncharacterized protein n=1 Tax=Polyrhizophydium stewartii TaxID=2732419 RepID=A0ABR4NGJ2_9FUNG